jgi:hypothetical protein
MASYAAGVIAIAITAVNGLFAALGRPLHHALPSSELKRGLGKPMSQRLTLGATLLLPKTVGDFTNPLRGVIFVRHEPCALALRERLRIILGHKSKDGLVAVDSHGDRMNDCPLG